LSECPRSISPALRDQLFVRQDRLVFGIRHFVVSVQTIETSFLNAMNSRTMEILANWKPAILNRKVTAINGAAPKRRTVKVENQLDQLGPSTEGRVVANA
jgi:hypothetical protein